MVQISENASDVLLDKLEEASVPSDSGYRLADSAHGYRLRLDHPSQHDRVIRKENRIVFIVDRQIDDILEGVILDLADDDSERLALHVVD